MANSHAEHLAPAVSVDADGDDHRDRDDLMIPATFHLGGVQPYIRPVALDRAVEEGVYTLIDLGTQAGDLALLMPSIPMSLTRSSTDRVEMPWM